MTKRDLAYVRVGDPEGDTTPEQIRVVVSALNALGPDDPVVLPVFATAVAGSDPGSDVFYYARVGSPEYRFGKVSARMIEEALQVMKHTLRGGIPVVPWWVELLAPEPFHRPDTSEAVVTP